MGKNWKITNQNRLSKKKKKKATDRQNVTTGHVHLALNYFRESADSAATSWLNWPLVIDRTSLLEWDEIRCGDAHCGTADLCILGVDTRHRQRPTSPQHFTPDLAPSDGAQRRRKTRSEKQEGHTQGTRRSFSISLFFFFFFCLSHEKDANFTSPFYYHCSRCTINLQIASPRVWSVFVTHAITTAETGMGFPRTCMDHYGITLHKYFTFSLFFFQHKFCITFATFVGCGKQAPP